MTRRRHVVQSTLHSLATYGRRAAGAVVTTLFYDTFTGSDGTLLTAHTPDIDTVGGGWVATTGATEIQSNRAVAKTYDASIIRVSADVGKSNHTLTGTCKIIGGPGTKLLGFMTRFQDASNSWYAYMDINGTRIQIAENATIRATTAVSIASADINTTCITTASDITFIHPSATVTYSSTNGNTRTKAGIYIVDSAAAKQAHQVDNFKAEG